MSDATQGPSLHPILGVITIALLGSTAVFDVVHAVAGRADAASAARGCLALGLPVGLAGVVAGLWLWRPLGRPLRGGAFRHGLLGISSLTSFTVSGLLRPSDPRLPTGGAALAASLVGAALLIVSWRLGHRVGAVHEPDASEPAPPLSSESR